MLTPDQNQSLAEAAVMAMKTEEVYGLPAKFTLAQWALESGWGEHAPENNCFGIKWYVGAYGRQMLQTTEYTKGKACNEDTGDFATFQSLQECFDRHAELLTGERGPYAEAWAKYQQSNDLTQYIKDIAPRYSTLPGYASRLLPFLNSTHIAAALEQSSERQA